MHREGNQRLFVWNVNTALVLNSIIITLSFDVGAEVDFVIIPSFFDFLKETICMIVCLWQGHAETERFVDVWER